MIQALAVLLPVVYAAATALAVAHFMGLERRAPPRGMPIARLGTLIFGLALLLHVALFAARTAEVDAVPSFDGWWSISALALVLGTLHLVVAARQDARGTDPLVLGTVFLAQLTASAAASFEVTAAPPRPVPFYLLHVMSILVASGALVLSGLHGLLYLALFRQMRLRRFGPLFERLPPLDRLAHLMRRTALAAFVLLVVGTNGGIWWAHAAAIPGFNYKDPGVVLSLGLCVYFAAIAFSARIPGATARRTSLAAAIGLLLLVASLTLFLMDSSFHWTR